MSPRAHLRVALLALVLPACGQPFQLTTPRDFARMEHPSPPFGYRAVSAYGVALGVRVEVNEAHGSLEFWSEAIDRTLRRNAAYHPDGMTDVRAADGSPGRRLQYVYGDAEGGSVYWAAVFVTPERVFVVEAGGTREAFARARGGIEQALASFRVR